ncbi:MAG: ABC transporter substrate-binding protein [Propionibacteriaceae bacterium]|jgi:peptide/nickel transport system substrate-binding protein|nr:ABC transporter substrate-binding protein [Propionibacteriaceae bacterium]
MTTKFRRTVTAAGALLAVPLLLAACSQNTTTPTETSALPAPTTSAPASAETGGATFTYAISGDPSSLNPINTGDRWGLTVTNLVYSPLARVETDGTMVNELAESITPSDDGLSVVVKLKPGILWSDGEPLTADDVVFTYTNKAVKANGNADLLWIGDAPITATAVDDLTVRFDLPSPSAAALSNIAVETYIIPQHIYGSVTDFSGAELDPLAVGTGPYKLVEYQRGEYLKFEANENYYGDPPGIPNIVLRIVSNADTAKAALQTGEVDAYFVTPNQIADLAAAPVDVYPYAEGRVAYLGVVEPKVPDVRVRQALFFSLNRTDIDLAAFLDPQYFQEAYSILPPSNPYATTDLEKYDQDVDKAKALLAEAGAEGVKLVLGYAGNDTLQQAEAALIQSQAAAAGITIELSGVDGTALYDEIEKGADSQFDLFLGGYIMGLDPDAYSLLFKTGASANYFSYSNPATDTLFEQGAIELDNAQRKAIYADLQAQIADDAVFYALADNLKILGINQRIGGVDQARLIPIYTFENFAKLTIK